MGSVRIIPVLVSTLSVAVIVTAAPAILMRIAMMPYTYTGTSDLPSATAALVLGASVIRGNPSPILAERTEGAATLYRQGKVGQILLTGAVEENYDEVTPMRSYLVRAGVSEKDIALDMAGFDTFSSMYRARNVFLADSLIILTQDFHLPRALFIARSMHINARGLAVSKAGSWYDYVREIPASWKALLDVIVHRSPSNSDTISPLIISGIAAR